MSYINQTLQQWLSNHRFDSGADTGYERAAKLLNKKIVKEVRSINMDWDEYYFKELGTNAPFKTRYINFFVVLENGTAVALNENPSTGLSLQTVKYKGHLPTAAAKLPIKEQPSPTAAATAPKKEYFTLEEMRGYLEDLYCETAGGYNDYGKNASDYDKAAVKDVQLFLEARGLAEKPEIEKKAIALKKELESFGKVEQCEVTDRDEFNRESATMFHVKITDGFNGGATNTFACMGVVLKAVGAEFPYIHKQETDYGIFHLILKK